MKYSELFDFLEKASRILLSEEWIALDTFNGLNNYEINKMWNISACLRSCLFAFKMPHIFPFIIFIWYILSNDLSVLFLIDSADKISVRCQCNNVMFVAYVNIQLYIQ